MTNSVSDRLLSAPNQELFQIQTSVEISPLTEIANKAIDQINHDVENPSQLEKIVTKANEDIDRTVLYKKILDIFLGVAIFLGSLPFIVLIPVSTYVISGLIEDNKHFQAQADAYKAELQAESKLKKKNLSSLILSEAMDGFNLQPPEARQNDLQAQIQEEYAKPKEASGALSQFAKDMGREFSFTIQDSLGNLETPVPSPHQEPSEKVQAAVAALAFIEDPAWNHAIQATCNQGVLNFSIGGYMASCLSAGVSNEWEDEGLSFTLKLDFHDDRKVFHMEISRDKGGNIDKIDFTISTAFDLIQSSNKSSVPDKLFQENVVESRITFSLTLNEIPENGKQPVISNYNVTLT